MYTYTYIYIYTYVVCVCCLRPRPDRRWRSHRAQRHFPRSACTRTHIYIYIYIYIQGWGRIGIRDRARALPTSCSLEGPRCTRASGRGCDGPSAREGGSAPKGGRHYAPPRAPARPTLSQVVVVVVVFVFKPVLTHVLV